MSDWCGYTYPESNEISCDEDIIANFKAVSISSGKFPSGGIPLLRKGDTVYLNDENESTVIFGETGSKKKRSVIAPLMVMSAGAGESAFVTDVKGELSTDPKLQKYLRSKGVHCVYLDFRTFAGDGYNILEQPLKLYKAGKKDAALTMVARLVNALSARMENDHTDPFWAQSAKQYISPLIELLFTMCTGEKEDMVNMLSLSAFANYDAAEKLKKVDFTNILPQNSALMFKSVLSNPEKTLACIVTVLQSMIQDFTMQKDLMDMLSYSTFDVSSMYAKPTFVFLIVPDETSAFDDIAGMLIDIFYTCLIDTYSSVYQNHKEPKCRINFICDEFCNLRINDMKSKISASRSRFMRWFLVCQSKNQLDVTYPEAAGTIIGNCKNTLFLQSCDPGMLDYISDLCGETKVKPDCDSREALVTADMLRALKKERTFKQALFIRESLKYFAELPDICTYSFLEKYDKGQPFRFTSKKQRKVRCYTPEMLRYDAY